MTGPDPLTPNERKLLEEAREDSAPTGAPDPRPKTNLRRQTRRVIAIVDRLTGRSPCPQDEPNESDT